MRPPLRPDEPNEPEGGALANKNLPRNSLDRLTHAKTETSPNGGGEGRGFLLPSTYAKRFGVCNRDRGLAPR